MKSNRELGNEFYELSLENHEQQQFEEALQCINEMETNSLNQKAILRKFHCLLKLKRREEAFSLLFPSNVSLIAANYFDSYLDLLQLPPLEPLPSRNPPEFELDLTKVPRSNSWFKLGNPQSSPDESIPGILR